MKSRVWLPLGLIGLCVVVMLWVWRSRGSAAAGSPLAALREKVGGSSMPIDEIRKAPPDVAGRYILSIGEKPAKDRNQTDVLILEAFADGATSSEPNALVQGRNAVMSAGYALASTERDDPSASRLKQVLLKASSSEAYRVRSTFVAVCSEKPELLHDSEITRAIDRLAKNKDMNLKISERAASVLAAHAGTTQGK